MAEKEVEDDGVLIECPDCPAMEGGNEEGCDTCLRTYNYNGCWFSKDKYDIELSKHKKTQKNKDLHG